MIAEPRRRLYEELLAAHAAEAVADALVERVHALPAADRAALASDVLDEVERLAHERPQQACRLGDLALRVAEPRGADRAGADALALLGRALEVRARAAGLAEDCDGALAHYARALGVYAELVDELGRGRVLRGMALAHMRLGNEEQVHACASEARAIFERLGEQRLLAQLEVNLGIDRIRSDEYAQARVSLESARARFAELDRRGEPCTVDLAIVDFNLAVVEQNANELDAAQRAFESARETFEEAGFPVRAALCEYSLAFLEFRRGRFEAALRGLEGARGRAREIEWLTGEPLCDLDLAEIHLQLDARYDAQRFAARAAARFAELGMRYEGARAEAIRGTALARLATDPAPDPERRADALACLERAQRAFESAGNEVYATVLEIQMCELRGSDPDGAMSAVERRDRLAAAHARLAAADLRVLAELAALALARVHVELGELDAAHALLAELVDPDCPRGVRRILLRAQALQLRARMRRAQGDAAGGIEDLHHAVEEIERTYARVPRSDIRMAFFRDWHGTFTDLAWFTAEQGDAREGLVWFERGRARSLREAGVAQQDASPRFRALRERLDWLLARRLDTELGGGDGNDSHHLRRLRPGNTEILEVENELSRLAREGAGPVRAYDAADLERARGDGDVLLVYLTTPHGVRAFRADEHGVTSATLDADAERLAYLRDRLCLQVDKLRLGRPYFERHQRSLQRSIGAILDELGERLLRPLFGGLDGRQVVIVPHGVLHEFPFHALQLDGVPLVERCEIGYALSTTSLARARARGRAGASEGAPPPVLVTGTVDGGPLARIASEIERLHELYGGRCERIAPADLHERLSGNARGALLHIASHGLFEHANPSFSSMSLGQRFLIAHEIQRMTLDLDLVTLSGCDTGRKGWIGGDEVLGLSRAFVRAGARATLGSLWAVDDEDAFAFTTGFYERLAAGATARRALAETQRSLRAERPHPYSWAPFTLVGDPDVTVPAPAPAPSR